ncbi:hypothetical protein BDEG_24453 [Batrachochytrium dendrobatidis JEL423]|uniref:Uncharacterized protein n=1 Tax=Batrachochytrium dendrobatidis (strain JEL423) TaxID=403673 RepID=A0A177WKY2_BATDL|nr:hypothetical protein BDEG_24453 [Batrachochytrium dendrobatidis JEL423]
MIASMTIRQAFLLSGTHTVLILLRFSHKKSLATGVGNEVGMCRLVIIKPIYVSGWQSDRRSKKLIFLVTFSPKKQKMNELLSKPVILNELTDEEWKQVQQLKNKKKPSIPFSKATCNDCVRSDGLALNIDYATIDVPSLHIPTSFPTPVASDFLCENLSRIKTVWVLDNEKACRIVIDAILTEVLLAEANDNLMGFCEVKNDWEGTGFGYTGDVDYMFGSSDTKSVDTMDSFLLVVEAKKEWPDSAIPQVLCEAGCLLKKRLAAGKETPVFAVLTNGLLFRFFAIDIDGIVYASEIETLKLGKDGTYDTSTSLSEILRWFTWFMTSIKSVSLRASSEDLTDTMIADSLTHLRSCFGPKFPIHSNKVKKAKIRQ